jgi:hypothetical protein
MIVFVAKLINIITLISEYRYSNLSIMYLRESTSSKGFEVDFGVLTGVKKSEVIF